ncbi:MAG: hypothetical protein ACK5HR_00880 [Mycoplasmatales bacterium]
MISIFTIIIILCLINYYLKKDIFVTTILGLSLTFIYLVSVTDFSLSILMYKKNVKIELYFIFYTILIITFRLLNDRLSYSYIQEKIQDIFDHLLHEKKLKFIFLAIVGSFIYTTPVLSIILLIFLGAFLRISRYNLIIMPFVLISTFNIYSELVIKQLQNGSFSSLLIFLIILYSELLIFLIIERYRHLEHKIKKLIIDIVYYGLLLIINIVVLIILHNVITVDRLLKISLIITLILGIYLATRLTIFINKEKKELIFQDIKKIQHYKLPYLIICGFIISYCLGYLIYTYSELLGITYYIIINLFYLRKNIIKQKLEQETVTYIKFLAIGILSLINLVLLNEMLYLNSNNFVSILDNYVLNHNNFLAIIISVQNYIFFPILDISSEISDTVLINSVLINKLLLTIKLQMIISLINIYFIHFIFRLKKRELIVIISILLIFSLILQIIVYTI